MKRHATMFLTMLALTAASFALAAPPEPVDMCNEVVDVYDGEGSSGFSYYGTSPESPDGRRLTYTVYPDKGRKDISGTAQLWVCNRDLTGHRKLAEGFESAYHNGARAFWIDNRRLVYDSNRSGKLDRWRQVIDVDTGEVLHGPFRVKGAVHLSVDNKLIFHGSLQDNWDEFAVRELDCDSGDLRKITTVDAVNAALNSPENAQIGHIQPSADGSRFLFRYSSAQGKPRMGCIRISDGSLLSVFPGNKPGHQLWFDNETVMGVNKLFKPKHHGNVDLAEFDEAVKDRWYQRFKLEGGLIETLAGPTNHGAGSPDRNWYASDPDPDNRPKVTLSLYRRGNTEPAAILMKHPFKKLTVSQKVHVNPSFSRDGKRVYFFRAVSSERFKASFVDISKLTCPQ